MAQEIVSYHTGRFSDVDVLAFIVPIIQVQDIFWNNADSFSY